MKNFPHFFRHSRIRLRRTLSSFLFSLLLFIGAGCGQSQPPSTTATAIEDTAGIVDIDVSASEDVMVDNVIADDRVDGAIEGDVDGEEESIETTIDTPKIVDFTLNAANFTFSPSAMTVKKGDTVRVNFVNGEGFHDFRIDEFDVATQKLQAGAQETVEFVADTAGTFEYYCSVGSHRAMGMKGTLTVE